MSTGNYRVWSVSELSLSIDDTTVTVPLDFDDPDDLPPAHPANWYYPRYADGTPHELAVSALLVDVLESGNCFVDCGAHVGYFSALAATLVDQSGTVISVEPASERHDYIERIVRANCGDVTHKVVGAAVGASDGEIELDYRDEWRHFEHVSMNRGETVSIPSYRLDTLADRFGTPDVVKVDVEGNERAALEGAEATLPETKVTICELHPNKVSDSEIERCLELLSEERDIAVVDEASGRVVPLSDYDPCRNESYVAISAHSDTPLRTQWMS